jgi:hypothetical protein
MKNAFQVLQFEPVPDKPHLVRLVGPPYKPADPNCRHLTIPIDKDTGTVSPLVIKRVLTKFQIEHSNFLQALHDSKLATLETPAKKRPTGSDNN